MSILNIFAPDMEELDRLNMNTKRFFSEQILENF